jgi:hypothetical protein
MSENAKAPSGNPWNLGKLIPGFSRGLVFEIRLSVGAFLFGQGEIRDENLDGEHLGSFFQPATVPF